jgi:hypothetical protein
LHVVAFYPVSGPIGKVTKSLRIDPFIARRLCKCILWTEDFSCLQLTNNVHKFKLVEKLNICLYKFGKGFNFSSGCHAMWAFLVINCIHLRYLIALIVTVSNPPKFKILKMEDHSVARFFMLQHTYINVKNIPNNHKINEMAKNRPNGRKIHQIAVKETNIFDYKNLKKFTKIGIFGLKNAIWQPW